MGQRLLRDVVDMVREEGGRVERVDQGKHLKISWSYRGITQHPIIFTVSPPRESTGLLRIIRSRVRKTMGRAAA
jgi:hypothetical protein